MSFIKVPFISFNGFFFCWKLDIVGTSGDSCFCGNGILVLILRLISNSAGLYPHFRGIAHYIISARYGSFWSPALFNRDFIVLIYTLSVSPLDCEYFGLHVTWVKLYSLAKLLNIFDKLWWPLSETTACRMPCLANMDFKLSIWAFATQFGDFYVMREIINHMYVLRTLYSNKSVPTLCNSSLGKVVVINSSASGTHILQKFSTRSSISLLIPGHHTDCFAPAWHLVMPWWPLWIFSKMSTLQDFGITILHSFITRPSCSDNSEDIGR